MSSVVEKELFDLNKADKNKGGDQLCIWMVEHAIFEKLLPLDDLLPMVIDDDQNDRLSIIDDR